jgi:hypothetical protein
VEMPGQEPRLRKRPTVPPLHRLQNVGIYRYYVDSKGQPKPRTRRSRVPISPPTLPQKMVSEESRERSNESPIEEDSLPEPDYKTMDITYECKSPRG